MMRVALKVMPPILAHWPNTSEADIGAMAFPPIFPYIFLLYNKWQSDRMVSEGKVCRLIPPCEKTAPTDIH